MVPEPAFASDNRTVRLNGQQLMDLRRARALSREQLAEAAAGAHRLSVATIKRAERGAPIYLETARRVAGLLDISLDKLLSSGAAPAADAAAKPPAEPAALSSAVAVAVLPFHAIGSGRSEMLAAGLTEDLTTRLGSWWFPVICYGSSRAYRGQASALAANDLQVAYVIEGSAQASGAQLRVRARLVRVETGEQLWCAEYTRKHSDLLRLQDELTGDIVTSVHQRLLRLEGQRLEGRSTSDLDTWELLVRGSQCFYEGSHAQNQAAREYLLQAVQKDANAAQAWYLLALTYQQELVNQWSSDLRGCLVQLQGVCSEFGRRHRNDPRVEVVSAYLSVYQGRRAEAAERLQRAIEGLPNLSRAYCFHGQVLAMGEDPDRALEDLEISLRLSPCDPQVWTTLTGAALAHFAAERYAEAVDWAERSLTSHPEIPFTLATLVSASMLSGQPQRAQQGLERLRALQPRLSLRGFEHITGSTNPEIVARFLGGLRAAGLT